MANPLANEREIYERIKKQKIVIHPLIWQLIDHHISNDLYMINLILGSTVLDGENLSEENAKKIIGHTKGIKDFLGKLSEVARPNSKDV